MVFLYCRQTHHHKHVVNGGAQLLESGEIHMEHDYAFKSTEDEEQAELTEADDTHTLEVETLEDSRVVSTTVVMDTEDDVIMVADTEAEESEVVEMEEEILEEDDNDEDDEEIDLTDEPVIQTADNILMDRTTDIVNLNTPMMVKDHKCYTIRIMSDSKETHQCVYECDICGKRFRNKRCAKLCKNTAAAKDPYSKYYLCEICGKVFTYISSFIAHHNFKHSEQKLFLKQQRLMECSVCLKKFSTKWNLKTHMQSHMNVFPYLCEFCGKKFKKSDIFKIHLRIHTGIKPYACPQCDKRFATKGMMTTHLRSHTGEKPYSCEFCDKSYAGMTALRMHQRTHTGERPFRCHLCPTERTFVTKKALRFHLKQPLHD